MESASLTLCLLLLCFWCVNADVSTSNATTPHKEPRLSKMGRISDTQRDTSDNGRQAGSLPCGSQSLAPGQTVTIQSQNYPFMYPVGSTCKWTFLGTSADSSISITCNDFTLRRCSLSSVQITGQGLNVQYCGIQYPFTETSGKNVMEVDFQSTSKRYYGFSCTVTASAATGITTPSSTSTTASTSTSTIKTSTSTTSASTSTTAASTSTSTRAASTSTTAASTSTSTTAAASTSTTASGQCRCGRRNPVVRIVGGNPTTVHEYPWQVALTTSTSNRPYCGGSIISNQWILTASHCVSGSSASSVYVVVGEHDWSTTTETSATQKIRASRIIMHPNYNSNTYDNDLALIQLSSALTFQPDNKIAPVCLPDASNAYSNVTAIVTGWGTLTSGGSQPNQLYEVEIPTMSNTQCQQYLGNAVTNNMICAGLSAGGKDSCQGDSGGPMVTAGNTTPTQPFMVIIGLVSWGYGCAQPNNPGVYTRVGNYLSWISTNIAGSQTCPRP